ncbi:MAG: Uncharacterised protein [Methanobacteriota archaeon]|nr:MAG: Uncharacterised protein [Euryarchaeota archaeon]
MNAINQAASTPAPFPKLSLAIPAIGKMVSAPYIAGKASIAHHDASAEVAPSNGAIAIPANAIDQVNNGGRGFIPPTG